MKKSESPPSAAPGGGPVDPLEELFRRARGDGFSREEASELWSRTGAAVGLGAPGPRVEPGTAAGSSVSAGGAVGAVGVHVKTIVALLIGGGLAVGGAVHLRRTPDSTERPVAAVAVPVQASPVGPAAAEGPGPRPVDVTDLPTASGASTQSGASSQPRVASRAGGPAGTERRDVVRATSASRIAEPAEAPVADPVREVAPRAAQAPAAPAASPWPDSARSQGGAGAPVAPAFEPSPTEGALLLQARRELGSDPAGTLALTVEHARRFPAGALAPEREVLAIEALARLGRTAEAEKRLDAFRDRYPQSPHVARLAALIARP